MTSGPTRALIIGIGQIGTDLAPMLAARGWDLRFIDRVLPEQSAGFEQLSESFRADPDWRARWVVADVMEERTTRLIAEFDPHVTFHMAAVLSATGERNPDLAWKVNVEGSQRVMDALRALQARDERRRMLVLPSSIAAFGKLPAEDGSALPYPPFTPNEYPQRPTTMYGISKVMNELVGEYYSRRGWLDFRSLRFPGLLNATPPGGGSSDYANMMYFKAAEGGGEVEVFVREDARIPFMYMPDAVRALLELAEAPEEALTRRTYNIAAMSPSAAEMAACIQQRVPALKVRYVPDHRQAIVDSWPTGLDDAPARADWGWAPRFDLEGMTDALLDELARA